MSEKYVILSSLSSEEDAKCKPTSTKTNNETEVKPKRLSGAGRRRMRYLLKQGKSQEEARRLAQNPLTPAQRKKLKVVPRPVQKKENPTTNNAFLSQEPLPKKPKSPEKTHEKKLEIKAGSAAEQVKVGVVPIGYPNTMIPEEELDEILNTILGYVTMCEGKVKPQFQGTKLYKGYIIITCLNHETAKWLETLNGKIFLRDGTELVIVDENNIPEPLLVVGFFRNCLNDSTEHILKLIGSQNQGLYVDKWKVYRRVDVKPKTLLVLGIDPVSAARLPGPRNEIAFKFGTAILKAHKTLKSALNRLLNRPLPKTQFTSSNMADGFASTSRERHFGHCEQADFYAEGRNPSAPPRETGDFNLQRDYYTSEQGSTSSVSLRGERFTPFRKKKRFEPEQRTCHVPQEEARFEYSYRRAHFAPSRRDTDFAPPQRENYVPPSRESEHFRSSQRNTFRDFERRDYNPPESSQDAFRDYNFGLSTDYGRDSQRWENRNDPYYSLAHSLEQGNHSNVYSNLVDNLRKKLQ